MNAPLRCHWPDCPFGKDCVHARAPRPDGELPEPRSIPPMPRVEHPKNRVWTREPLTNIVTDAINGYNAGLAGEPMGRVSEAFDCGWTTGEAERRAAEGR